MITALVRVPSCLFHEIEAEMVELPGIDDVGEPVAARLREPFQIGHRNRKPTQIMGRSDDGQHPLNALKHHCRALRGDALPELGHERFNALGSGTGLRRLRRVKLPVTRLEGEPLAIPLFDNTTALGAPLSCRAWSR